MTSTCLTIEEKSPGKPPSSTTKLELQSAHIKVKDLIRLYVAQQVNFYNSTRADRDQRIVPEHEDESMLNSQECKRSYKPAEVDAEYARAIQAFQTNVFFLFIDGKQMTDPEMELHIGSDSSASFVRLTPLVGG